LLQLGERLGVSMSQRNLWGNQLKQHLLGPARPSDESCYLNGHIAFGVASADLSMIGPCRFEHLQVEGVRFEV
jgi:hypothetical protein